MDVRTTSTRRTRVRARRRSPFSERFDQYRTGSAPVGTPFEWEGALPDTEICHLVFEPYQDEMAVVGYI